MEGIWGGARAADNTQNINTSIHAQAEPAVIKPFQWGLFFVVIYSAAAHILYLPPVWKINLLTKKVSLLLGRNQ